MTSPRPAAIDAWRTALAAADGAAGPPPVVPADDAEVFDAACGLVEPRRTRQLVERAVQEADAATSWRLAIALVDEVDRIATGAAVGGTAPDGSSAGGGSSRTALPVLAAALLGVLLAGALWWTRCGP